MRFAAIAVLLATFGIYGAVMSAVVVWRREIGVRLALGESRRSILWRATRYGAMPTLAGLILGVPLALGAGQLLARQLFAVGPMDLPTLLAAAAGLGAVGLVAALVPAWQAIRVNPASTLRHEGLAAGRPVGRSL
jgi:putative ABC transport system permease protein